MGTFLSLGLNLNQDRGQILPRDQLISFREVSKQNSINFRASVLLSGITRKDVLKHLKSFDTFPELTFDSKYFVEVFVKVRLSRLMFEFYDLES